MIKLSVSIFGRQTARYRIYTMSREPIRLPEYTSGRDYDKNAFFYKILNWNGKLNNAREKRHFTFDS